MQGYFREMCSGSEAGSYLRLIDFVYHSTLGLRVIKKNTKKKDAGVRLWGSEFIERLKFPARNPTIETPRLNAKSLSSDLEHNESLINFGSLQVFGQKSVKSSVNPFRLFPSRSAAGSGISGLGGKGGGAEDDLHPHPAQPATLLTHF